MYDLLLDEAEFVRVIGEVVPEYQRGFVMSAVKSPATSEAEYDRLGTTLTGEQDSVSFLLVTGPGKSKGPSLWTAIKSELYDLFCTNSRKYASIRKKGGASIENTIKLVATAVAGSFNIALGVVVGAVTIALIGLLKVGRNAWCSVHQTQVATP